MTNGGVIMRYLMQPRQLSSAEIMLERFEHKLIGVATQFTQLEGKVYVLKDLLLVVDITRQMIK